MPHTWTFHSAGELIFGLHAAAHVGEHARRLGLKRVYIVTDAALVRAGILEQVRGPLLQADVNVGVFAEGQPEPSIDVADHCILAAQAYQPDGLIGLGGGSNMDLTKIVAVILSHGGGPRDYFGDSRVPGPVLPVICIPTTAGTGSEVTPAAVLTDTANELKVSTLSNFLRPRLAIVDPLLTVSCPAKVTADSGIDALTHAIEAYTAVDYRDFPLPANERSVYQGRNPLADALAEKAIRLIGQYVVQAVQEPDNVSAREGMALAATLAGLAFSNSGVALVHAMEYPLGGATHCSHGAGNGLLLPYVLRYNLPACEERLTDIARWLAPEDREPNAEKAITAVEQLRSAVGIPARMRELGATADQLPGFAAKAFAIKRILRVNPRYPTQDEIEAIYRQAL